MTASSFSVLACLRDKNTHKVLLLFFLPVNVVGRVPFLDSYISFPVSRYHESCRAHRVSLSSVIAFSDIHPSSPPRSERDIARRLGGEGTGQNKCQRFPLHGLISGEASQTDVQGLPRPVGKKHTLFCCCCCCLNLLHSFQNVTRF